VDVTYDDTALSGETFRVVEVDEVGGLVGVDEGQVEGGMLIELF
jgi:hypothetical protein